MADANRGRGRRGRGRARGHGGMGPEEEPPVRHRDQRDLEMAAMRRQIRDLERRLAEAGQGGNFDDEEAEASAATETQSEADDDYNPWGFGAERRDEGFRRARPPSHQNLGVRVDIPDFEGNTHPDEFIDWLHTVERVFDINEPTEIKRNQPETAMSEPVFDDYGDEEVQPEEVVYADSGESLVVRRFLNAEVRGEDKEEDSFGDVPLTDCGEFTVQEFNWDPPSAPSLVREGNITERDGDGDISPRQPNHSPSPTPQETEVVAASVAAETLGDTAAELMAQHREGDICSEERQRNIMKQHETSSVAEITPPVETADSTPAIVEVADANGDITANSSDAPPPSDPVASVSRDATSHPLPQQNQAAVLQTAVSLPVLVQDAGRQSAQVNVSNVLCNGHVTTNENGTVGLRLETSNNPLWQMFPVASPMVFPHGLHADPLKNELTRCHDATKMQLKREMEEEMEGIRKRYEEMIQEEENKIRGRIFS